MKRNPSRLSLYVAALFSALALPHATPLVAGVDQLWITEVVPSTGQVEVTHVGSEAFTTEASLPFCHRFNYRTVIPAGTQFDAGETIVFELTGLNASDSDLFLYRNSNFGSAASIVSGLRYGAETALGRTGVAAAAGIWPSPAASTPAPEAGQALLLVGEDPFSPENWAVGEPDLGNFQTAAAAMPSVEVRVTIENLAPENGTFLTPLWVGVHDGQFDSYDGGEPSSPGIERIAEDGNPAVLSEEFVAAGGSLEAVLNEIGPIGPGAAASARLMLDPAFPGHQYFSYVSMVIPSNDAYVANGNPLAHRLFDDAGNFQAIEFVILGSDVNDAGTEVNDELPENTAFFGQAAPNTGTPENGVNADHPGFKPASEGGILADPMFANADFTASGYEIARIRVERVVSRPVNVEVTIENLAPENGTFLTPLWVGFHNGGFDSYDGGEPSTPGVERIAEDGNPAVLAEEFFASGAGTIEGTLNAIGPIVPTASTSQIFTLDANALENRFFSYASMIIPSNDAYVANGNPTAHPIFDSQGNFIGAEFEILGTAVNDAGTEVNDELPENTAFFGQAAPNTGVTENGVNADHPGFKPASEGGILADPMFANADFNAEGYRVARVRVALAPQPVDIEVSIENLSPDNGTFLTPLWFGFHNGGFDSYDGGEPSSPGVERIAEDGNAAVLGQEFLDSGAGTIEGVLNAIGPIAPGATTARRLTLNAVDPTNRYFSYASMVIPSNDAYVANGNPLAHQLFDEAGNLNELDFIILGRDINDAGTEVNDELPENTAFFGQAAPNTGVTENGVNTDHPGFKPASEGGILADPMFANADFTVSGYQLARVRVKRVTPRPVEIKVTIENLAPEAGTFLTPLWAGFHDGGFDSYDSGSPSSPGLERIAEDGNPEVLASEFFATNAGQVEGTLNGIGPIGPGASTSKNFVLDANASSSRYFSYVSMVIPSNDAYVANGDPLAHPIFDELGNFVGADFEILGTAINDAGTEVNDELPENTAFFGQMAPNTGTPENGVNADHPGFKPADEGGILADERFANADFTASGYRVARIRVERVAPAPIEVEVTIENLAPENGTFLTPLWVGFHNGGFDSYDGGQPSSPGVERIAEDGNTAVLAEEFFASVSGTVEGTLTGIGPIAPGASTSARFELDANSSLSRYFSYASMVIPSNDAYVANGNPLAHPLFDENGNFVGAEILIAGSAVNDAGTEVNDELPENTAFFGQAAPNTGTPENGVNTDHPGFKPASEGGILADPMFANADFTADGYNIARITVTRVVPNPTPVTIVFQNGAPAGGTYLTPVWFGVHDGTFDVFDTGSPASAELESLAEDGNTGPIAQAFLDSGTGSVQTTVFSEGDIPPFAPGESGTVTLTLDANNPQDRYLSFLSMVIPSNDAFVGNGDPLAYPIFDAQGNLLQDRIVIGDLRVYDAGTEVNDEIPENTAFLAQSAPNTGETEGGVVTVHPGFNAAGTGGVVDNEQFANASINAPGDQPLQILVGAGIIIESISFAEGMVTLTWSGGAGPYMVEARDAVDGAEWETVATTAEQSAEFASGGDQRYFRVTEMAGFPAETARFRVTFDATWSRATHPTSFPPAPHFSPLIGATHNADLTLWEPGGIASPGIELMAETGGRSTLTSEIQTHQVLGTADTLLSGGGVGRSPGVVSLEFEINQSHPLVSLVTMIAPSPDWFLGVHGLELMAGGVWVDEISVDLWAYDSGTDSGPNYTSSNADTTPHEPIFRITETPLAAEDNLPPLGTFTFTRLE